jgi:hypothetical protein
METKFSSVTVREAQTFPFFELPRELRDLIYDNLWSATLIAFRHKGLVTIARYQAEPECTVLHALPS